MNRKGLERRSKKYVPVQNVSIGNWYMDAEEFHQKHKTGHVGVKASKQPSAKMKTRTHFAHSIDMLGADDEIQEHLAGVEDYLLAEAVWREAIARWPKATIILRQGARVVHDSRRPRVVK